MCVVVVVCGLVFCFYYYVYSPILLIVTPKSQEKVSILLHRCAKSPKNDVPISIRLVSRGLSVRCHNDYVENEKNGREKERSQRGG